MHFGWARGAVRTARTAAGMAGVGPASVGYMGRVRTLHAVTVVLLAVGGLITCPLPATPVLPMPRGMRPVPVCGIHDVCCLTSFKSYGSVRR